MGNTIEKSKLKKPAVGDILHLSQDWGVGFWRGSAQKVVRARYDQRCSSGLRIYTVNQYRGLDSSWFEEYITPAVLERREQEKLEKVRRQDMKDWYDSVLGRAYIAFRDSQPNYDASFETIKKFAERIGAENLDTAIQYLK